MGYRHHQLWRRGRSSRRTRLAPLIAVEVQWIEQERKFVAEQLEAIEDGEQVAGTERLWCDYRNQVRAWKLDAKGYPDSNMRPLRPS